MSHYHRVKTQATHERRSEIARVANEFAAWLGTFLRNRHEAALRRRTRNVRLRSVNPTPV